MRFVLAALLVGLALPAAAQSAIPSNEIIEGAIEGYIRPAFHQFAEETGSLELNLARLCEAPSADTLERARNQFKSTVIAFSRVEFLRLGPLTIADRLERLLFWPDRKGIALRQVQAALAEEDPTAADPRLCRTSRWRCRDSPLWNISCSAPAVTASRRGARIVALTLKHRAR